MKKLLPDDDHETISSNPFSSASDNIRWRRNGNCCSESVSHGEPDDEDPSLLLLLLWLLLLFEVAEEAEEEEDEDSILMVMVDYDM